MQRKIETIEKKFLEPLEDKLGIVAGACICVVVILMVMDVLGRYVFGTTIIIGIYSINERYLFALIVFLGLGVGYRSGVFPRLTFLEQRAPAKQGWLIQIVCLAIELILYVSVTVYEVQYAIYAVGERLEVGVGPHVTPIYHVMCVMFFHRIHEIRVVHPKLWKTARGKPSKQVKEV